jgi:hypothetical protein
MGITGGLIVQGSQHDQCVVVVEHLCEYTFGLEYLCSRSSSGLHVLWLIAYTIIYERLACACNNEIDTLFVILCLSIRLGSLVVHSFINSSAVMPNVADSEQALKHKYSSSKIYNSHVSLTIHHSMYIPGFDTSVPSHTMTPRKSAKTAEEQYPPAPSAEDDNASMGDDELEELSQDVIDEYLAYNAMNPLRLNDDEDEYGDDDASEGLQSTPDGYEHYEHKEPTPPHTRREEPDVHNQTRQRIEGEPPQRPTAPLQYYTVPVPPPPTVIVPGAAPTGLMAFPTAPQSQPMFHLFDPNSGEFGRSRRTPRRLKLPPRVALSEGDYYPRGVVPGGYSRGVDGLPHYMFPNQTVRRVDDRPNGQMPFSWLHPIEHPIERNVAHRTEPTFALEFWADTFTMSRRIEEDMAALRRRLERLQEFYYRS